MMGTLTILFISLWTSLLFILIIWSRRSAAMTDISANNRNAFYLWATIPAVIWVTIIQMLMYKGFFKSFNEIPPRQLLFLAPPMLSLILVMRSKNLAAVLKATPLTWLIYIQSFRIIVEYILYMLYQEGKMPTEMTFEGQNFDIVVGVTAPIVAYLLSKDKISKKVAIVWNVIGILILSVTVITAILAMPTKFQLLHTTTGMRIVGRPPWSMLPAFLVPFAFYGHVLSIKQLRLKKE